MFYPSQRKTWCMYPVKCVSKSNIMRNWYLFFVGCDGGVQVRAVSFLTLSSCFRFLFVFFLTPRFFLWIKSTLDVVTLQSLYEIYFNTRCVWHQMWALHWCWWWRRRRMWIQTNDSSWTRWRLVVVRCCGPCPDTSHKAFSSNVKFYGLTKVLQLSHLQCQLLSWWFTHRPLTLKRGSGCNSELEGRFLSNLRVCFIYFANKTSLLLRKCLTSLDGTCRFQIAEGQLCVSNIKYPFLSLHQVAVCNDK